jgi:hypothetical protein
MTYSCHEYVDIDWAELESQSFQPANINSPKKIGKNQKGLESKEKARKI